MSRIVPGSQGPFHRGERLTAAKLNDVVASIRPTTVYGHGHVEGDTVLVDSHESMWMRLDSKDTSNNPIKYGWHRVTRLDNGTWQDLSHNGTTSTDYAIEVNNANLTVGGSTVYKAERATTSAEWLFANPY